MTFIPLFDGPLKTTTKAAINISDAHIEKYLSSRDGDNYFIPVFAFLLKRGERTILFDVGAGNDMQTTLGHVRENLTQHDISPADVTDICLTHMHSDHANGLITHEGEAVYPQAHIYVMRQEYDFWMQTEPSPQPNIQRTRLRSLRNMRPYADKIHIIDDQDMMLGCRAHLAAGHSPGHTVWEICDLPQHILVWGDIVHFSDLQIAEPDCAVIYDLDPNAACQARYRILHKAATENQLIAGAHVSGNGLCTITEHHNKFISHTSFLA